MSISGRPILIAGDGLLSAALRTAFLFWDYDSKAIISFTSSEAHKIPERLPGFGEKAMVVTGVFTRSEEERAKALLMSVRTLREDCARCPFVLLALDEHLPPILRSPGCHHRILPRDAASLKHIHTLQAVSDREREQFITDFGKPVLLDKIVKVGGHLLHDFAKQSLPLRYARDFQTLREQGRTVCSSIRASFESLNRDAGMIGLSLAEVWPETEDLIQCLIEMERLCAAGPEGDFARTKMTVREKREEGIRICELLQDRLKNKGDLSWKAR